MTGETLGDVIRRLGRSGGLQDDLAQTDAQLLDRFARQRDEPAFAALMARHGPMVLGLSRRLLHDSQDAEDAFQAAFLILARRAGAIQRQTLLAAWLYGVAWRVAVRLRGQTARRREREQAGVDLDALPADAAAWSDVRWVVHEEVQRLPDAYRSAVILCCLEGKTNEEAARLLRRPVGTVKSRLTRARELLRSRLTRRGMAISVGVLGTILAANAAPASAALADATIRAALPFAAGGAAAGGVVSVRAVALSQGVLRTMMLKKVTFAAALALAVVMLGGIGGVAYQTWAAPPGDAPKAAAPAADRPPIADAPKDDHDAIQGTWRVESIQINGKEWDDDDNGRKQKTAVWTITADKIVQRITAPRRREETNYAYTLDPTQTPRTLDVSPWDIAANVKGQPIPEVYSLDGDTLKISNALAPNRDRPKEIASKEGSQTILYTLKRTPPAKDEMSKMQGTWRVVAVETEGIDRNDDTARDIKKQTWTIQDDKLVVHIEAPGPARDAKFTCSLDSTMAPMALDLTADQEAENSPRKNLHGVCSVDGDDLMFCYPMTGAEVEVWRDLIGKRREGIREINLLLPAGPRPKEVATRDGSKTTLLKLKRQPADKQKPEAGADADKIQGTWVAVSGETDGKKLTPSQLEAFLLVITPDQLVFGPNLFRDLRASYKLDPTKAPKEIELTALAGLAKWKEIKDIYRLDGDRLTLCIQQDETLPGPTEFAAKAGSGLWLFDLKRWPRDGAPTGLTAEIVAPKEIASTASELKGEIVLTNTGDAPVRICTLWSGAKGGGPFAVTFCPDWWKSDRPPLEESAKAVLSLAPGKTYTAPFTIRGVHFQDREVFMITAFYSVEDPDFARKLDLWRGQVEAAPVVVRVHKE